MPMTDCVLFLNLPEYKLSEMLHPGDEIFDVADLRLPSWRRRGTGSVSNMGLNHVPGCTVRILLLQDKVTSAAQFRTRPLPRGQPCSFLTHP